jgi:hypothetical protein
MSSTWACSLRKHPRAQFHSAFRRTPWKCCFLSSLPRDDPNREYWRWPRAIAVAIAVGTTMLSGLYLPAWMTPVYNEAKISPCVLRFQFAAEGGWDVGGALAGGMAAAICFSDCRSRRRSCRRCRWFWCRRYCSTAAMRRNTARRWRRRPAVRSALAGRERYPFAANRSAAPRLSNNVAAPPWRAPPLLTLRGLDQRNRSATKCSMSVLTKLPQKTFVHCNELAFAIGS